MGDNVRYQAFLDLPLRLGNLVPNVTGPHQMLDIIFTPPRIPCASIENLCFDDWYYSHLLGHNNSKPRGYD